MVGIWRRAGVSGVLALAMVLQLDAQQTYNAIGSGGPLWWFPANDTSYSRHHDRWYVSHVEALNNDWGSATSFPTVPGDEVWVSAISGAPPNSACDVNDEVAFMNVGPLHPDDGVDAPRTNRRPDAGYGYAGLQMSMHIGEWWQGMKQRPPLVDGGHSVGWIDPVLTQWQLHGGSSFTMPCLGVPMVQMHGVEDGGDGNV